MATLHIFNPETDYALAHDRRQYTPPAQVCRLRDKLGALPALWGDAGDVIVVENPVEVEKGYLDIAAQRGIAVVTWDYVDCAEVTKVEPWGWNRALCHTLQRHGIDDALAVSDDRLTQLRNLAHRRTTIPFHKILRLYVEEQNSFHLPAELHSVEEVAERIAMFPGIYLKAPWSSSGRGVISTQRIGREAALRWAAGIIERQGSVMAEVAADKAIDFASEWECDNGDVMFRGLSMFITGPSGRYEGNISAPQDKLAAMIAAESSFSQQVIEAQRIALKRLIAPYYNGPAGIDMLADKDGRVNACVEINLRRTMGMAAASLYRLTDVSRLWKPTASQTFI